MSQPLSRGQWTVGATGFFSLFSLIGIMFYGLPFFYDIWVKEFGWSRTTVTSGNAFGRVTVWLFGFLAGWCVDRWGPRRLMLAGILMGGVALVGLSRMNALWQFYLFSLLGAAAYMCGGPLPNQVLTSRWFDRWRGRAMSVAYLGVGIGGMLVPQIARWLNGSLGWRTALALLGAAVVFISFPMAWFVRNNPPDVSGETRKGQPPIPLGRILKSRNFYLLLVGSMCAIAAVSGTVQHLKLFFSLDLKYSQQRAADIISLVLLSSIIGRLLMGWLADRVQKKYVMLLIYALVACSIPLLYFASEPGVIYVFALVFGIGLGGDYMIIPLMAAELFGIRVMGRIMGIILMADGFSDALAPMLAGWLRDRSGNYVNGFAALIGLGAVGFLAVVMLPAKSRYHD